LTSPGTVRRRCASDFPFLCLLNRDDPRYSGKYAVTVTALGLHRNCQLSVTGLPLIRRRPLIHLRSRLRHFRAHPARGRERIPERTSSHYRRSGSLVHSVYAILKFIGCHCLGRTRLHEHEVQGRMQKGVSLWRSRRSGTVGVFRLAFPYREASHLH